MAANTTSVGSAGAPTTGAADMLSGVGLSGGATAGAGDAHEKDTRGTSAGGQGSRTGPVGGVGAGADVADAPFTDASITDIGGADAGCGDAGGAGSSGAAVVTRTGRTATGSRTGDAGIRKRAARRPAALLALIGLLLASIVVWCLCRGKGLSSAVLTSTVTTAIAVFLPVVRLRARVARLLRSRRHGVDELTGLPGRRQFTATATQWLAGGHRPGGPLPAALILVDLDRLRDINGTLGHEYGDQLLRVASERIRSVLRPEDLLARVDGDEFAALLRGVDLAGAEAAARRIREALQAPVHLAGLRVPAEVSVGIARSPEHGRSALELLRRAEEAMYTAKGSHSGQRVYDPDCHLGSRASLGLRGELREALDAGQIELRYQPKVDMRSGRISGVEALVRWRHPAGGLRPPGLFLPEMERAGLMGCLTRRVLDLALADCARWHAAGAVLPVSVNVPPSIIVNPDFVDVVRQVLERHGLPPAALVVEITEDGLITVLERAQRTLTGLREHGVRISLDDYGTGLCSLAYLMELPADEVKLDQRFLRNIDRDASAAAIVRSTVALAHALRLRIVAEGVETSRSWASLAAWQCDEVQGYFVSRPLTAERVLGWLTEWDDRLRWLPQLAEPVMTGPIRVTAGPRATRAACPQGASGSARPAPSPAATLSPAPAAENSVAPSSSRPSRGGAPGSGARSRGPREPQRGEAEGRHVPGPFVAGDRLTG
ncbi:EAL domain-containing protein [Parafrankia sp. FMc2]|uniref:EAL domain-containing protein n=1 Tax=Parafrankia sp. FMc2 TaxID=3233196 RepID=UPI0034D3BC09